ncbi:MAG TPA: putative manganese-dependent inorganic diphosphatase [Deltaproteobacteria bacterium]|nr:putative manganese-dependent inorganic diphosphatase [Deltaproteobacteria bacterium]
MAAVRRRHGDGRRGEALSQRRYLFQSMEGSATTYVIGHKNPDTDSIVSAIALAELKRATGMENVHAARAGDINPQTAFVLEYFGVEPPRYLTDVYVKAGDIMNTDVVSVCEGAPVLKVMDLMRSEGVRFVPVLDGARRPVGALTLLELARHYTSKFEVEGSRLVTTSLSNVVEALGARPLLDFLGRDEVVFSVYVGAMSRRSFRRVLEGTEPSRCMIIVGDREGIQMESIERGVGALIVTGGLAVGERVVEAAEAAGVSLVVSPYDTATTALLVRLSTPASRICSSPMETARPDELARDLRFRLARRSGIVVLDDEGALAGVVTKSSLLRPSPTRLILVDHNELSQAVDGADPSNIVEVVDHHRIGNFNTSQAITFICEPVGSTSTLVAELYRRKGVEIGKETAGLLLGGVMSDTVMLRSPTTTERDRRITEWLEEESGLAHEKFGAEIFAATSSIKKRGTRAVVRGDHKVFEAAGRRFGIGQVETIGFGEFHDERQRLREELERVRKEKELSLSALLVTDIVQGTSLLLAVGDKDVIYNLDYPRLDDDLFELKGIISRKKQVVPHIIGVFSGNTA